MVWGLWLFYFLVTSYGFLVDLAQEASQIACPCTSSVVSSPYRCCSPFQEPIADSPSAPSFTSFPRSWSSCSTTSSNATPRSRMASLDMRFLRPQQWQNHSILWTLWGPLDCRCLLADTWGRPVAGSCSLLAGGTIHRFANSSWRQWTWRTRSWSRTRQWTRSFPWSWTSTTRPATQRWERSGWCQRSFWWQGYRCSRSSRQRKDSRACLAVPSAATSSDWSAAGTSDCSPQRGCSTRSNDSGLAIDPPQQYGWAASGCARGLTSGHPPRPEGQWPHTTFSSDPLDQGPDEVARRHPSPASFAQRLESLRHRIADSLGGLCHRVLSGRSQDATSHPGICRSSPPGPDRARQQTCPSSTIGGTRSRRRNDYCNDHRLDPGSSEIGSQFGEHHRRAQHHGDYPAWCPGKGSHRHCGDRLRRCSSSSQPQKNHQVTSAGSSGEPCRDPSRARWQRYWSTRRWRRSYTALDPQVIAHQWPGIAVRPELCWLHSVCSELDFVSPWLASQNAMELAWECGTLPLQATSTATMSSLFSPLGHSAKTEASLGSSSPGVRKPAKAVAFDDLVELRIGLDTWPSLASYQVVHLGSEVLQIWEDKPWHLARHPDLGEDSALPPTPLSSFRLLGEEDVPQFHAATVFHLDGEDFDIPPWHTLDAWIHDLWTPFLAAAQVYRRGWYPTAYLRTWFLDDEGGLHEWHHWREFELDPRVSLWASRLRTLWVDQLIDGAALEVQLIAPPVPPIPGWTAHLGDLVLVQRPRPARCALLVRTLVRLPREDRLGLAALLVPLRQARHDLLRRTRLTFFCWQHECTISRGNRMLMDGALDHSPFSGVSISVDLGPDLPTSADENSLMQLSSFVRRDHDPPSAAPPFWESVVFDFWATQGATACEEVGPELFVQTWFVHHDRHRLCSEPRTWIAVAPMATWVTQLRELWEDLLDPAASFSVFVVQPTVPDPPDRCCPLRLVLVQGASEYKAILLSAIYQDQPGHQLVQAAFSSLAQVDGYYLQRLLGVVGPCQLSRCELWHAGSRQPFESVFVLRDGWAFELYVPPEPSHPDDFSLMAMGPAVSTVSPFIMDDPAIVQTDFTDDALDPDDGDSSTDSSLWKLSAIFSTQLEPVYGHTDWSSYDDLWRSAIDLFSPDAADLVAVHHVPHPPWDLEDDGYSAFIGELPEDQDDSGIVNAVVLIDVGFFRNRPDDVGDISIRLAKAVPPRLTRAGLFDLVGVHLYCAALQRPTPGPGCLAWRNHCILPTQDDGPLNFVHGDYVRIALPPSHLLPLDFSVRRAAGLCYRGLSLEEIGERAEDGTLSNDSAEELLPLGDPLPPEEPADELDLMQAPLACSDMLAPADQTNTSLEPEQLEDEPHWLAPLNLLWLHAYQGSSSEEWPAALTWYLDHDRAPLTTLSRALRLRPAPELWLTAYGMIGLILWCLVMWLLSGLHHSLQHPIILFTWSWCNELVRTWPLLWWLWLMTSLILGWAMFQLLLPQFNYDDKPYYKDWHFCLHALLLDLLGDARHMALMGANLMMMPLLMSLVVLHWWSRSTDQLQPPLSLRIRQIISASFNLDFGRSRIRSPFPSRRHFRNLRLSRLLSTCLLIALVHTHLTVRLRLAPTLACKNFSLCLHLRLKNYATGIRRPFGLGLGGMATLHLMSWQSTLMAPSSLALLRLVWALLLLFALARLGILLAFCQHICLKVLTHTRLNKPLVLRLPNLPSTCSAFVLLSTRLLFW